MKVERLRPECISCVMKNQIEKYPADISDDKKIEYMQRILQVISQVPKTMSAPEIVYQINAVQKEMFGAQHDYTEEKYHFNKIMLEWEDKVSELLDESNEPLLRAIQYAMMGNYIDFGAMENVEEKLLVKLLTDAEENKINLEQYEALKKDLSTAKKVVYLLDNCGEIVFDKLMIQLLQKLYPALEITAMVRGGNVQNDVTMEDAEQVGLTEVTHVMGNGASVAGTCLELISEEARREIETADVVISKGQGNFETLRKCGLNIYYIFLCKCDMFAREFNVPRFTGMLINDKDC